MIKTRVLTGWGLSRQCVCVCGSVSRGMGKCAITYPVVKPRAHRLCLKTLPLQIARWHALAFSWWAVFSEGLLLQQRWHKPFSSYLWPSTPYNTHSHTGSPTSPLPPSLFKAWFLFIKSVSSLFLISTFLCWMLFCAKSNPCFPPSLCLSLSALLHIFVLFQLCSLFLTSFLLLLFYLFHSWPSLSLPLLFAFFFQYPQSS